MSSLRDLLYSVYERRLAARLVGKPHPRHVGVIVDGNRRWAKEMGYVDPNDGHRVGAARIRELLRWCDQAGIGHVTLWLLSTDNHLVLVDVTSKGLSGKQAERALDAAGITVNRNAIPFDTRPPLDPSGVRIGTPALTTRGMREPEMRRIAAWIGDVLAKPEDDLQRRVRNEVRELCKQFPAPTTPE